MLKRGQSAMEFLMTYGWAILVVLVVLSSLYFLEVFNPKTTNTYSIKAPLLIQDMAVRDNGILFKISSNIADAASITDITINGQSCNSLGGFLYNPLFVNGNTYTGCYIDLGSYNKASGDINVRYSLKSGLMHDISGDYSGVKESGSVNDILEENDMDVTIQDNSLAFGWHGDSSNDYIMGRSGTLYGGVSAGGVAGHYGSATSFDGNNDYIDFGHTHDYDIGTGSLSVSFWTKFSSTANHVGIVDKRWGNTYGWKVFKIAGTGSITARVDNSNQPGGTSGINDDQWHHVVAVFDRVNDDILLYVDGQYNNGHTSANIPAGDLGTQGHDETLKIGTDGVRSYYFNGAIDEIHLWKRDLSSTEVNNLYHSYL